MKQVTKDEILNLVHKLVEEDEDIYLSSVEAVKIKFIKDTENEKRFEVTQMYESPIRNNFKYLKAFSELFNTDNVDIYDDISSDGCETCNYGSSYGYAIRVWE